MNNLAKIKAMLATTECDAIMIESPVNRFYATGFESTAGLVLITKEKPYFFTDSRYIEAASKAIHGAHIELVTTEKPYSNKIAEICKDIGINVLGFEDEEITCARLEFWREKLTVQLKPVGNVVTLLRAVKSREELNMLIDAQRIAEKSFTEILPLISTEITERELAAELLYRFMKNGADDKSFDSIIVSAERSSMPHGVPSDAKIGKGFLTIDFGAKKDGWCSDTTRTVCVGQPTAEMKNVYNTVLEAQLAGIAAAKPGVIGRDVHAAAHAVIEKAGYGEYFGHGFGHGLGIEIHEAPTAAPTYDKPLPEGAVISAEPGIYLPGKFGVRIEDVIYLTDGGNENITKLPKELIII